MTPDGVGWSGGSAGSGGHGGSGGAGSGGGARRGRFPPLRSRGLTTSSPQTVPHSSRTPTSATAASNPSVTPSSASITSPLSQATPPAAPHSATAGAGDGGDSEHGLGERASDDPPPGGVRAFSRFSSARLSAPSLGEVVPVVAKTFALKIGEGEEKAQGEKTARAAAAEPAGRRDSQTREPLGVLREVDQRRPNGLAVGSTAAQLTRALRAPKAAGMGAALLRAKRNSRENALRANPQLARGS